MSNEVSQEISARRRILFGGLGGIVPALIGVLAIENLQMLEPGYFLGTGIKITILFVLGALVPFVMDEKKSISRILVLGIAAQSTFANLADSVEKMDENLQNEASRPQETRNIDTSSNDLISPRLGRVHLVTEIDGIVATGWLAQLEPTTESRAPISVCQAVPSLEEIDSVVRGIFGLGNPAPKFFLVVARFRTNDQAKADRKTQELNTAFRQKTDVEAFALKIEQPFRGSRKDWYVLVGDKTGKNRIIPRFISPQTRQVIFDTHEQAYAFAAKISDVVTKPSGDIESLCPSEVG